MGDKELDDRREHNPENRETRNEVTQFREALSAKGQMTCEAPMTPYCITKQNQ